MKILLIQQYCKTALDSSGVKIVTCIYNYYEACFLREIDVSKGIKVSRSNEYIERRFNDIIESDKGSSSLLLTIL